MRAASSASVGHVERMAQNTDLARMVEAAYVANRDRFVAKQQRSAESTVAESGAPAVEPEPALAEPVAAAELANVDTAATEPAAAAAAATAVKPVAAEEWTLYTIPAGQPNAGATYRVNTRTGETVWARPED